MSKKIPVIWDIGQYKNFYLALENKEQEMKKIQKANENTMNIFNCLKSYGCSVTYVKVTNEQISLECKINLKNTTIHIDYLVQNGYIHKMHDITSNGHRINKFHILKELVLGEQ